jgi:hypothetical protein
LSSGRAALARVGRAGSFFGLSGFFAIVPRIWDESCGEERAGPPPQAGVRLSSQKNGGNDAGN